MGKDDLIIKVLKDWRETADKFGVDSPQAKEKGAIAMPLLFENRELLPESNQRFQLRGLDDIFTIDEIKTMNDGGNCGFYANKNFIADLAKVEGKQPAETEQDGRPSLSDTERNILEALGTQTMTGEVLAKKAGYPYNSNFKSTLSSLRKRGILGNKSPRYFVEPKYHSFLKRSDQGQD